MSLNLLLHCLIIYKDSVTPVPKDQIIKTKGHKMKFARNIHLEIGTLQIHRITSDTFALENNVSLEAVTN